MDQTSDTALAQWTVPQCPFRIEFSTSVLDEIRIAVTEAFHALSRGGVEIGGLLLGTFRDSRLVISGSVPIECEHAFGPSFTLSSTDLTKLEKLLAAKKSGELRVAGWYHSHTRSHIHLSEADIAIHRRFFPESWQVALVLRPRAFEPVRAGFFFREADGSIQSSISYLEFALDAQPIPTSPVQEAPVPATPTRRAPLFSPQAGAEPAAWSALQENAEDEIPSETEPPPAPLPAGIDVAPPTFRAVEHPRSRHWLGIPILLTAAGLGAGAYLTHGRWLPQLREVFGPRRPVAPLAPIAPSFGLSAIDSGGQLQIRWNREAPEIRAGTGGLLAISDEGVPLQAVGLDAEHLHAGSFVYTRRSGRVDVRLTVFQPGGSANLSEVCTFLGPAIGATSVAENTAAGKPQADPVEEAARLKAELEKQALRTRKLELTIEGMRQQMQDLQRKSIQ